MENVGLGLGDSATYDQEVSRFVAIQRCNKYLIHACQCIGANCSLSSCQKMKRVHQHAKSCRRKKEGCPICKQFISLCCYHAKHCQEPKCAVIPCVNIKTKLRLQQLQKSLHQGEILKRRIIAMQNRGISCPVQTGPGISNFSNQPSPGARLHSSPHPPLPDIGRKLVTTVSPPTAHQYPQLQSASQMRLLQQAHLVGGPGNMPSTIGNSSMGPPQVMPNPGASLVGIQSPPKPAWQQLLQVLKSPPSTQQQQQVLAILKSNPSLMAAFIKQRTAQKQEQLKHQEPQQSSSSNDHLACKVCMDRERSAVFQPCGHFVSCWDCSNLLSNCPICRRRVTDKIRTYFC